MNLRDVHKKFSTDEQCLEYLQQMRWPDGVVRCPLCGNDKIERYERPVELKRKRTSKTRDKEKANVRRWFFICLEPTCRNQFSPTSGTIFHDTHLPLIVWFQAIVLMLNAKKGISAAQLQRNLGLGGYKTAWYLNHRIREAMAEGAIPTLGGIVEVDECYLGGVQKGKGVKFGKAQKATVFGARQRGGQLRLTQKQNSNAGTAYQMITDNISPDVEMIVTDESKIYPAALKVLGMQLKHKIVCHIAGEYVRGNIHTNTIESAFSLLKRGVIGNFHKVSIKHLQRYLNEFTYRFNRRNNPDAFIETVRRLCGFEPLPFSALTSSEKF